MCKFCVYAYINTHTYTRICLFVMHSHKFLYMKHCWLNKTYPIIFMGMKKASKQNLHIVKTCMPMNESYHILSFDHFTNSPTNYLHDHKLRKMRTKLKQSLRVPFLTHELYVFTRTDLCFSTCQQVVCEMFI